MKITHMLMQYSRGEVLSDLARRGVPRSIGALALSLVASVFASSSLAAGFDSGFEGDELGGWQIDPDPAADGVQTVEGPEGPDQFLIYSSFDLSPDGAVVPQQGDYMLRMGTPKLKNETQNRGINGITQTFDAESSSLAIALRLFSLDHRGDDILRVSLTSAYGDVPSDNTFDFNNAAGDACQASLAFGA